MSSRPINRPTANGRYAVYKITNAVDGKCYIGLTTQSLQSRFNQHVRLAKRGHKSHLSSAMRVHGFENFEIKLVRGDAKDYAELEAQERSAIVEFRSTEKAIGYNICSGGTGQRHHVVVGVDKFETKESAALFFALNATTVSGRLKAGWSTEQAYGIINPPAGSWRKKTITFGEAEFDSIKAAAKAHSIKSVTVTARLLKGWTIEQALNRSSPPQRLASPKPITVDGRFFPNFKSACKFFALRPNTVRRRLITEGCTVAEAFGLQASRAGRRRGTPVTVAGTTYRSLAACARSLGIKKNSITWRINTLGEAAAEAVAHFLTHETRELGAVTDVI